MSPKDKQIAILGGGAVVAYLLLKKPKPGQKPNALQKLLNPTAARTATSAGGYAGSGQTGGGAVRPTTTNLATNYGRAGQPAPPSLAGFGSNPIASLIGGISALAGSILKGVRTTGPTGTATATAPKPQQSSGSSGGPSAGSSGGSNGAQRPGSSPYAEGPNIFGGPTTVGSTYNPADFVGINPNTGLYDPDYDPSVQVAGFFDASGNWVQGEAPPDYSQLPGYGTALPVLDENGTLDPSASPALGNDTGTEPYQTAWGQVSGPDDGGYYYYPDGSIAYGYGEAPQQDAPFPDGYQFAGPIQDDFVGPIQDNSAPADSFADLPGYGIALPDAPIDASTWGSVTDDSGYSSEDTGWVDVDYNEG